MRTNWREPSPESTVCAAKRIATKRSTLPSANAPQPPHEYALLPAFCRRHLPSGRRLRQQQRGRAGDVCEAQRRRQHDQREPKGTRRQPTAAAAAPERRVGPVRGHRPRAGRPGGVDDRVRHLDAAGSGRGTSGDVWPAADAGSGGGGGGIARMLQQGSPSLPKHYHHAARNVQQSPQGAQAAEGEGARRGRHLVCAWRLSDGLLLLGYSWSCTSPAMHPAQRVGEPKLLQSACERRRSVPGAPRRVVMWRARGARCRCRCQGR